MFACCGPACTRSPACAHLSPAAGRIIFELFRYKKGSTQEPHAPLVSGMSQGLNGCVDCVSEVLSSTAFSVQHCTAGSCGMDWCASKAVRATAFEAAASLLSSSPEYASPCSVAHAIHMAGADARWLQPCTLQRTTKASVFILCGSWGLGIAAVPWAPNLECCIHRHRCSCQLRDLQSPPSLRVIFLRPCPPQAVDNFLAFCQGVDVGGRHLSYVGVPFTRVVKRFVVQAGDVVNKDGTGEVTGALQGGASKRV